MKITKPRQAGSESREDKERPGSAREGLEARWLASEVNQYPCEYHDDRGSHGSRDVRVDALDTYLCQDRRGGSEEGGKERPCEPCHGSESSMRWQGDDTVSNLQ